MKNRSSIGKIFDLNRILQNLGSGRQDEQTLYGRCKLVVATDEHELERQCRTIQYDSYVLGLYLHRASFEMFYNFPNILFIPRPILGTCFVSDVVGVSKISVRGTDIHFLKINKSPLRIGFYPPLWHALSDLYAIPTSD